MTKLIAFATLALAAMPSFAVVEPTVPVPGILPLLGIGLLAVALVKRRK